MSTENKISLIKLLLNLKVLTWNLVHGLLVPLAEIVTFSALKFANLDTHNAWIWRQLIQFNSIKVRICKMRKI